MGMDSHLLPILRRRIQVRICQTGNLLRIHGSVAVHNIQHLYRRLPQNIQRNRQISLSDIGNSHNIAADLIPLSVGVLDHIHRGRNGIQIGSYTNHIDGTVGPVNNIRLVIASAHVRHNRNL